MKKFLSLILAVMMLLGCMSLTAFAAEITCPRCEGTGTVSNTCEACDGEGSVKCEKCDGWGCYHDCPDCYGNPCWGENSIKCPNCNEEGFTESDEPCDNCYGQGYICQTCENRSLYPTDCEDCDGIGHIDCEACEGGTVTATCPLCGGSKKVNDAAEDSKSGTTPLTAIKETPFSYEIVFPTTVPTITAAGVYTVGQAKVENVVSATDNTVISYTAATSDFKLSTDESKTLAATYHTEEAATNAFPTDAVKVYENKADAESIPTMYVKITEEAWNAAADGTYTATVTYNFTAEEDEPTPMRRVYVGSMTNFAPICDDPATNLKVHYQGEGIDGLADLVSTGTTATYDIYSFFYYCTDPMTFDVYYADIPEAATTYRTKNVKSGDESEAEDWSNTANADGKILLVWDHVGGHANHLFDYTPAE